MSTDKSDPRAPSLADFWQAVDAMTLLGQIGEVAQNARSLAAKLEVLSPAGLARLLDADELATARAHAAAFASCAYPLLAQLERLGLYERRR